MKRIPWLLASLLFASVLQAQSPAEQLVLDAAQALGGRERILALRTLTIEGYGSNPNIGQAMTPEADPLLWMLPDYKRSIDFANRRQALEFTRRPAFPAVFDNFRMHARLDGDVAFNIGGAFGPPPAGPPPRLGEAVARERRQDGLLHPLSAVRAALTAASVTNLQRLPDGNRSVDVTTTLGDAFTLTVDSLNRPVAVSMAVYHPNLGDTRRTTTFGAYENLDGLRLPKRLVTTLDRWVEYDIGVMKHTLDADLSALAAPPETRAAPLPAGPNPQTNLIVNEVAKGIWFLTGGGIPSIVIEFAEHVTLVEAGTEARFQAVVAKARELVPGKPVTQLILSHHHFDHTGGLRAAVAEGLTVITHRVNARWFGEAVTRRHSIVQDSLARSPRSLKLVSVDDSHTLKDDTMEVVLYHLTGSTHGDGILALYFPRERLFAEADVWNPGAQIQPHIRSLAEEIGRRGLVIERVIPLHGLEVQPFSELERTQAEWANRRVTTTTYPP
jgi:glyoxylase-like metal-dependent hydrolase (beta-lactamase superfamily II)